MAAAIFMRGPLCQHGIRLTRAGVDAPKPSTITDAVAAEHGLGTDCRLKSKGPHDAGLLDTTQVCNHRRAAASFEDFSLMLAQSRYELNLPHLEVIGQTCESDAMQHGCLNFQQVGGVDSPLLVDAFSGAIFLAEQ